MKRIITTLALVCISIGLYAGHETGGVIITYKGISGQPLKYLVTVRSTRSIGGVSPPFSLALNIESSCFVSYTQSLPLVSNLNNGIQGMDYCTVGSSSNFSILVYEDTVAISAHCTDVRFSTASGPGRFDNVQNLQSNFDTPYFFAQVNTMLGANTSPQVNLFDIVQTACLNKNINYYGFSDVDGDSLFFAKSTTQKMLGATVVNFSYKTGFSKNRPLGTATQYLLNSATGTVQSQVTNVGMYVLPIKYSEYRHDTLTNSKVLVGSGLFNFLVIGTSTCSDPASISILHESVPNSDSIQCGSNTIRFIGTRQLSRGSLSPSGSDIQIISNKQGSLAISSAILVQDSIVEVTLAQAPPLGDTLSLVAKIGTDGNVIISRCGTELTAYGDTLTYYTRSGSLPMAAANLSNQFLSAQYNSGSSIGDSLWWDFGDGNGSSSPNGNHNYAAAGTYTVNLIAFGVCGTSDTSSITVQVCDSISANFNYNQAGDTVSFYSQSSGGISNYYWDFGDGQTATGDSTNHVYSTGGTYTAVLTVTNVCGDTVMFSMTVETCLPPQASWTYTVVSTTSAGMTIDFDGTASTNAASFIWDFGDGTTDNTTLTPTHLYQTPGLHYYVKLTVDNTCQQSSVNGFKLNEIGIDELGSDASFEVYPNPAADVLKISLNEDIKIKRISIYDLNGKQLSSENIYEYKQGETINLSTQHLKSGSYLLEMESEHGESFKKVIVKK